MKFPARLMLFGEEFLNFQKEGFTLRKIVLERGILRNVIGFYLVSIGKIEEICPPKAVVFLNCLLIYKYELLKSI